MGRAGAADELGHADTTVTGRTAKREVGQVACFRKTREGRLMPLLASVEWGTVPDWVAVIGTTAAFMARAVDDHQDPPGGERAANPLQRDGISRHATTPNAKVRDAIKALPLDPR